MSNKRSEHLDEVGRFLGLVCLSVFDLFVVVC